MTIQICTAYPITTTYAEELRALAGAVDPITSRDLWYRTVSLGAASYIEHLEAEIARLKACSSSVKIESSVDLENCSASGKIVYEAAPDPHAEAKRLYAEDEAFYVQPWLEWEAYCASENEVYETTGAPRWWPNLAYRRKPAERIKIGDVEIDGPIRNVPKDDQDVWYMNEEGTVRVVEYRGSLKYMLDAGKFWRTQEQCLAFCIAVNALTTRKG